MFVPFSVNNGALEFGDAPISLLCLCLCVKTVGCQFRSNRHNMSGVGAKKRGREPDGWDFFGVQDGPAGIDEGFVHDEWVPPDSEDYDEGDFDGTGIGDEAELEFWRSVYPTVWPCTYFENSELYLQHQAMEDEN